jgi:CMP-N-acetylneuraminic acid synthetase
VNISKTAEIAVIIPVRMGSKRLLNKNILPIRNKPMFVFVANNIKKSKYKLNIFISSESKKIKDICIKNNLNFIKRPKQLSLDFVEKQEAIVHAIKYLKGKLSYNPKIVISLQANSPEVNSKDLDKALKFFNTKLYVGKQIKELISVNPDNIQNGAFRILTNKAVFQKTLSTKMGIFFTNYLDIHTKRDYQKARKKIENEKN